MESPSFLDELLKKRSIIFKNKISPTEANKTRKIKTNINPLTDIPVNTRIKVIGNTYDEFEENYDYNRLPRHNAISNLTTLKRKKNIVNDIIINSETKNNKCKYTILSIIGTTLLGSLFVLNDYILIKYFL